MTMILLQRQSVGLSRWQYTALQCKRRWPSATSKEPQILLDTISHPENSSCQVAQLTLNRPRANAMGIQMMEELNENITTLEESAARCLVITSCSDKVFSAGADLKERAGMSMDEAEQFVCLLRDAMQRIADLPMPTIAAMEGVAVGGGLELALAADLRIAGANATLGLPETSLAIIPGAGGTQRLPRLIGVSRAKQLIWTGRKLTADEAMAYGLVEEVVEAGEATQRATELAFQIAQNGPVAIRASKQAIDRGLECSNMREALEIEREHYAKVLPTKDRLEGLAAFEEGRKPQYTGR